MSLPKELRLCSKNDFTQVFRNGRRKNLRRAFAVTFKSETRLLPRFGVVVSKKVLRKAHDRNYLRRIVKHCLFQQKTLLQSYDVVWVAQPRFSQLDRDQWFDVVQQQIKELAEYENNIA